MRMQLRVHRRLPAPVACPRQKPLGELEARRVRVRVVHLDGIDDRVGRQQRGRSTRRVPREIFRQPEHHRQVRYQVPGRRIEDGQGALGQGVEAVRVRRFDVAAPAGAEEAVAGDLDVESQRLARFCGAAEEGVVCASAHAVAAHKSL